MGAVYLAWQQRLERLIAAKVLPASASLRPESVTRFKREIAAIGKLHHPSIVTAFDANEHNGIHYLLMEFVPGETLSQIVRREKTIPIAVGCEVIRQAAAGMQHVHDNGLIHRDIKPSNLMLSPESEVRILDLGLARFETPATPTELTSSGQIVGTIEYMAPEQAAGGDVDIRSDIYGLGATLFKLTTGESPLQITEGASKWQRLAELARGELPSRSQYDSLFPVELRCIVDRMLAADRAERFDTPQDVVDALQPFCDSKMLADFATRVQPVEIEVINNLSGQETVIVNQEMNLNFPRFRGRGLWVVENG